MMEARVTTMKRVLIPVNAVLPAEDRTAAVEAADPADPVEAAPELRRADPAVAPVPVAAAAEEVLDMVGNYI
jgi:hypothetical protein